VAHMNVGPRASIPYCAEVGWAHPSEEPKFPQMIVPPEPISSLDLHDSWDNSEKIDEYHRILVQLNTYKSDLRTQIASLASAS
jgi:hypothetical protein